MNCHMVKALLDRYVERELTEGEQSAVESHLENCAACRQRFANLQQMTTLLHQFPVEEPAPDLAARIVAAVEAQALRTRVHQPWPRVATVGLGVLFSALLLLALGYQTLLAWRQGGAGQFISLLVNDPELMTRYRAEAFYAILESLPVVELALTLGLALVCLLLVEQLVGTLMSTPQPQLNGNHSGGGVA